MPTNGNAARQPLVIGLALDVSGSMKSSITNERGGELARVEGLQAAMDTLLEEAALLSDAMPAGDSGVQISIFVYAFGLRLPNNVEACDLLRLVDGLSGAEELASKLAEEYERRLRTNERQVAIEVMGSSAMKLLSMSRTEAETAVRTAIKARIASEIVSRQLAGAVQRLDEDLTIGVHELADKWVGFRGSLSTSNELLGGGTPMCKCLSLIYERFKREHVRQSQQSRFVLFIVSDGEATDGNPRRYARRIARLGVQIVSCFVAASDVTGSKQLNSSRDRHWSRGAAAMFDVASRVSADSPEIDFLEKRGWRTQTRSRPASVLTRLAALLSRSERAKLFAQVNHSEHLKEFMQVVLAPIRSEQTG
jgi:hypothetical protein